MVTENKESKPFSFKSFLEQYQPATLQSGY